MCLDFGAARSYPPEFVAAYYRLVRSAAEKSRDGVLEASYELGLLCGRESSIMLDAHTEAAFVIGEPFAHAGRFDFRASDLTQRIKGLTDTMLKHRLCPPPPEVYTLHRKLSGAYLTCIKLGAVVDCARPFRAIDAKAS